MVVLKHPAWLASATTLFSPVAHNTCIRRSPIARSAHRANGGRRQWCRRRERRQCRQTGRRRRRRCRRCARGVVGAVIARDGIGRQSRHERALARVAQSDDEHSARSRQRVHTHAHTSQTSPAWRTRSAYLRWYKRRHRRHQQTRSLTTEPRNAANATRESIGDGPTMNRLRVACSSDKRGANANNGDSAVKRFCVCTANQASTNHASTYLVTMQHFE
jgi:hypothetical protein